MLPLPLAESSGKITCAAAALKLFASFRHRVTTAPASDHSNLAVTSVALNPEGI